MKFINYLIAFYSACIAESQKILTSGKVSPRSLFATPMQFMQYLGSCVIFVEIVMSLEYSLLYDYVLSRFLPCLLFSTVKVVRKHKVHHNVASHNLPHFQTLNDKDRVILLDFEWMISISNV